MRHYKIILITLLFICNYNFIVAQEKHPRIYPNLNNISTFKKSSKQVPWKKQLIATKKANIDTYLKYCEEDSQWLVSRLQMNWNTKHSKVFLKGRKFSHSEGEAPVPTVRFSGSRDWATNYKAPSIEEITPFFDDPKGLYLLNKETNNMEWVHPSVSGHIIEGINRKIMLLAEDAAFLYWQTGDKRYAEFAAPIFMTYMEGMYYRDAPLDLENSNQQRASGLATFEVIHEQIVVSLTLIYDFLYDYLKANDHNLDHMVAVFQKWGDQIINNGIPDNNWNFFQARFLTYIALALDSDKYYSNEKGREYFLKYTFDISTERQIALKEAILVYDQETGIWPEAPGYSLHVTSTLLEILTLLDNFTNKNEFVEFPIIEKAALAAFQYLFPSGYTAGFGDTKHKIIPPKIFELLISNYHKYNFEKEEQLFSELLEQLMENGEYKRELSSLFELFFYVDYLKKNNGDSPKASVLSLQTPTFYAPNVSMFLQRMGQGDDAVMISMVGSNGNHAHSNGISMEMFANNYAIAPDMGIGPSYWHPEYREYYSQFPAHNTVVVNGISESGRMRGYHPFTLEEHYPKSNDKTPLFDKVTFSKVSFVEPKTNSDQQRLMAIVKVKEKSYVIDVFHSRNNDSVQKHDYFFHGLGQSLEINDVDSRELKWGKPLEFGSKYGDLKAYDYFSDLQVAKTSSDLNAVFNLQSNDKTVSSLKMWIKGASDQKVFSVMAPKSNGITKGTSPEEMLGKKIPTVVLRRETEAWSNPFVVVFNPFIEDKNNNPISDVNFQPEFKNGNTEQINVTHKNKLTTDQIIVNSSINDIAERDEFYQKGLFSLVRMPDNSDIPTFIFISGVYKFEFNGWQIRSTGKAATVSIERVEEGFQVQTDQPIQIKIPMDKGFLSKKMIQYSSDQEKLERGGLISRSNTNQKEYRLDQVNTNVIIQVDF